MTATTIPIWKDGILWVKHKPVYIVRLTEFPGGESAVGVYGISKEDYKNSKGKVVNKDWHTVIDKVPFAENSSVLANIARSKFKAKKHKVEKPALFTARVQNGVSTFGGKEGYGFYELTPDHRDAQTNRWIQGNRTGVFILLDDIKWDDITRYDEDALINLLKESEKGNESIYRLDGNR